MKRTHENNRVGRLRKNPRYRRKTDQQNRAQANSCEKRPAHTPELCINPAETGEDIKTREADQHRQQGSEPKLCRSKPQLRAARLRANDNSVDSNASDSENEQPRC